MIAFALVSTALMGFLAVAVDIGYAFSQRRLVQNTADLAAIAGASMLAKQRSSSTADQAVAQAIDEVRAKNLLNPAESSATLVATYTDSVGNDLGQRVGTSGGALPATYGGIKVTVERSFPAWFAQFLGTSDRDGKRYITVSASGTATLALVNGVTAGTPGTNGGQPSYNGSGYNTNGTPDFFPYIVWRPSTQVLRNCKSELGASTTFMINQYEANWVDVDCTGKPIAEPMWQTGSNNFRGYLHNVSGVIKVGSILSEDTSGGDSYGNQPSEDLRLRLPTSSDPLLRGRPIILPVVDFAQYRGSYLEMRVYGFAWVKVTNVCTNSGNNCGSRGTVVHWAVPNLEAGPPYVPGGPDALMVRLRN
jgi:Flp pilus assembly protein TadG